MERVRSCPLSGVAAGNDTNQEQTYDAPSDRTAFHGAPPLPPRLAREVNGEMMGKLPFGNVGRGKKASQEARGAQGKVTVNVVLTFGGACD